MLAFLICALFAASGVYAALAIAATWRKHAPAVLALRAEMAACGDDVREMCYRVTGFDMPPPSAKILRPAFRRVARPDLPRADGWRAAA